MSSSLYAIPSHHAPIFRRSVPAHPVWVFVTGVVVTLATLLALSCFDLYPVPIVEKIVDPHMYYIRNFVHSLPPDVQANMTETARTLGLDIYQYNLQMCGYNPGSYWAWWGIK